MFHIKKRKRSLHDVYLDQIATQMTEPAVSSADSHRSMLSGTEPEKVALDKEVVNKDEKDAVQGTTTKPNNLEIYIAYMNGKIQDKKGKEIELKPDGNKLADGMNKTFTDDEISEMYDNLLKLLGFEQKESGGISDHLNPFRCGYLRDTAPPPPPTAPVSRLRRILKCIRKAILRPFRICRKVK